MKKETIGFKKLTKELIRLLFEWDNEQEVLSVPEAVRAFYDFFYFIIIGTVLNTLIHLFYPRGSNYEVIYASIIRIFSVFYYICLFLLFVKLLIINYKFLMIKGKNLKLGILSLYYIIGTCIFGRIYESVYIINQHLFNYLNPPVQITNVVQGGLKASMLDLDFIIYSFLTSLSAEYYKIVPNHNLISVLNVLQLLFTFFILSILVTLFLQKIKSNNL